MNNISKLYIKLEDFGIPNYRDIEKKEKEKEDPTKFERSRKTDRFHFQSFPLEIRLHRNSIGGSRYAIFRRPKGELNSLLPFNQCIVCKHAIAGALRKGTLRKARNECTNRGCASYTLEQIDRRINIRSRSSPLRFFLSSFLSPKSRYHFWWLSSPSPLPPASGSLMK